MSTGLIYDERFLEHDTGPGHPERPDRLRAVVRGLKKHGWWDQVTHLPFGSASRHRLARLHTPAYVARAFATCEDGRPYLDVADSAVCAASAETAALAAGGVLRATEAVVRGEVQNAFCAVRPPGHHAEADRSMGFCLFANAALAAEAAIADHGLERVAVVDFDVHHGNGTQHLLEHRSDVLFVSVHQHPDGCYPGTGYAEEVGTGEGVGFTVNVPLAPGGGDAVYAAAFADRVIPTLDAFAPQLVVVSAGFDAAAADPLAQMNVSTAGFAAMTEALLGVAERHAGGRLVSVLEGGYDLDALSAGVAAHMAALVAAGG